MWFESKLLVNGQLVNAQDDRTFSTINPATGEVLGEAADASVGDAQAAIDAARRAFDDSDWSLNVPLRVRCLRQLRDALDRHREEYRALIVAESGAPVSITYGGGLDTAIDSVGWYADLLERYEFTTDLGRLEVRGAMNHRWVEREAVGVASLIVPYNFPVLIALNKLAPALAAGCTAILKGPPEGPWQTAVLGNLIANETDIPQGVANVIFGSSTEIGAVLTTDQRVDMVSFTGSTATGRRVMAAASETVKRLFLELGGKSALVVLDDADMAAATANAGSAVCAHAGQGCSLTTRLLLPRSRYAEGVDMVAAVMAKIPFGDPTQPGNLMGPLITEKQRQKVDGMVREAVDQGARLVLGGGIPSDLGSGYFFEPTLLADVDPQSRIAQDEVFGPVLSVIPFDDDDDAIRIANDSIFGLSGAVFSGDIERAKRVCRQIRSGTLSINGATWYAPDAPFGGYKQSGIGREMGLPGLEEYLEMKTTAAPAQALAK